MYDTGHDIKNKNLAFWILDIFEVSHNTPNSGFRIPFEAV
jgi:hypothetical protein